MNEHGNKIWKISNGHFSLQIPLLEQGFPDSVNKPHKDLFQIWAGSRNCPAQPFPPQCKEIPVTVPCWQPLGKPACQQQPSLPAMLPYPTLKASSCLPPTRDQMPLGSCHRGSVANGGDKKEHLLPRLASTCIWERDREKDKTRNTWSPKFFFCKIIALVDATDDSKTYEINKDFFFNKAKSLTNAALQRLWSFISTKNVLKICNAQIISLPSHKRMITPTALASYSQLYLKNRFTKNIWKLRVSGYFFSSTVLAERKIKAYNYIYSSPCHWDRINR